jgi:nucleoid-associated protein YgaU
MRSIVWLGLALAALLIATAAVIGLHDTAPDRVARAPATAPQPALAKPPSTPPVAVPSVAAAPAGTAVAPAKPPSFDIVSVDPRGQAVIAGRAVPGDRVKVLDGDKVLGEVTADARGEWVVVPQAPIAPGNRQLALEATRRDGGAVRRSGDVVALTVTPPVSGQQSTSALAVLLPGDAGGAARVLQRPEPAGDSRKLALDAAEYGAQGQLVLSGQADPSARLNVYAGDRLLGTAVTDSAGKWSLTSSYRPPAGGVELRLDQLGADGSVGRRIAAPFSLPAGMAIKDGDTYVVQRGNSLWLIARNVYGKGMRYTAIFDANREQIRDPHWIYPGQQFKLPKS